MRGEEHEPDTRCGTLGTSWHGTAKSSIHSEACIMNQAPMHRRYDDLPREICSVSWHRTEGGGILPDRTAEVSRGHNRRAERAEGLNGREELRPVVEWRDRLRRDGGCCPASGRNSRLAPCTDAPVGVHMPP